MENICLALLIIGLLAGFMFRHFISWVLNAFEAKKVSDKEMINFFRKRGSRGNE